LYILFRHLPSEAKPNLTNQEAAYVVHRTGNCTVWFIDSFPV
jgi:hypothetical protein